MQSRMQQGLILVLGTIHTVDTAGGNYEGNPSASTAYRNVFGGDWRSGNYCGSTSGQPTNRGIFFNVLDYTTISEGDRGSLH